MYYRVITYFPIEGAQRHFLAVGALVHRPQALLRLKRRGEGEIEEDRQEMLRFQPFGMSNDKYMKHGQYTLGPTMTICIEEISNFCSPISLVESP